MLRTVLAEHESDFKFLSKGNLKMTMKNQCVRWRWYRRQAVWENDLVGYSVHLVW